MNWPIVIITNCRAELTGRVIMFILIESAGVEALRFDNTLYQRAIERNVLVATPTTLLTSLNIVRQLWRFEDQNKHTAELAKSGRAILQ